MALINCPECNNEVSNIAHSCPKCCKEPVWLYVIIGAVIVICFVVLLNKYSKKSN